MKTILLLSAAILTTALAWSSVGQLKPTGDSSLLDIYQVL
jgi:hypothetical protein